MYIGFLHLHSTLRWLLLICLVITLIKYMAGWQGNQPWKKVDKILGLSLVVLTDLQLITGLTLYFFLSPITTMALSNFGAAMKDAGIRFYAVEHFLMMVIALVLIHMGYARTKRAIPDQFKFRTASIFYLIALIIIFAAIPWGCLAA
jgi:hypothetical protein